MSGKAAAALAAAMGIANSTPANAGACPMQSVRWSEDCSSLASIERHGVERLRYLPIVADGKFYVSLGGELRARWESQNRIDFGIGGAPQTDSVALRGLLHADIRAAKGPRLFAQMSIAAQNGRSPGPRPFDESGPDIAQLFVEVPFAIRSVSITPRIGRQELPIGRNHLVGLRDGVVLRRAFDAVRIDASLSRKVSGSAFYGAPVRNGSSAFDDERTPGESFYGINLAHQSSLGTTSVFALHRDRPSARFSAAAGVERRTMLGVRVDYARSNWTIGAQAGGQFGEIADQSISAWGFGGDVGWKPAASSRFSYDLTFGFVSGDRRTGDRKSQNFDPFYPNLAIFSVAPLYYPTNQINLGASGAWQVDRRLKVRMGTVALMRYTTNDAIYSVAGRPLGPPVPGRLSAILGEVRASYRFNDHFAADAAYLHAAALPGVRNSGGDDVDYALLQFTAGF